MVAVPVFVFVFAPCAEIDTEAVVDAAGEELVEVAAVTPAREAISPSQGRAQSVPIAGETGG